MKKFNLLTTSTIFIVVLSSCNNSEKQSDNKVQLYDTVHKYDFETGEIIGDTLIPIEDNAEMLSAPAIQDSIPVFENKKRIGWMLHGKFIPREGVQSLHPPGYYESELNNENDSLKKKK